MTVSVTGSNLGGGVSFTVSGLPSGVTASPTQFILASGAQQSVTVAANSAATSASANLTINGSVGGVTQAAKVNLIVNLAQKSAHPPFRTGYVRTDAQWDVGFLNFFPQRWILYHAPTRRFFAPNTLLNRVDVIDATTEQLVKQITVPGAFVGDETPDHSAIYMGTQVGDVYKIDPVTMSVVQRFPAITIGPSGFAAFEVRALADGRLAMLGSEGGIPAVDGFGALGIWNPVDNSFFVAPQNGILPGCPLTDHIAQFALTADRTRVLLGSGVSGGAMCSYDPVTDAQVATITNPLGIGVENILVPADGKEILTASGNTVQVYDANGLFQTDQFTIDLPGEIPAFFFTLSHDGNTLYAAPKITGGDVVAYNWKTHQLLGWAPNMDFLDLGVGLCPNAVDETGLIAAVAAHGVALIDAGAALHPGAPTSVVTNTFVRPPFGPAAGGTNLTYTFIANPPATNGVFFGNQLGANLSLVGEGVSITTPPGNAGPVDVVALLQDGNLVFSPESFTYGPSIVEVATDSTTAEGGATGKVLGYGFGNPGFGGQVAPGLQVQVNGQAATNLSYTPNPLDNAGIGLGYFFPIESIDFTFPPGTAGNDADIVVSNNTGTTTASHAVHYLPAIKQFPLPGSVLVQGIYDAKRDVYYFSDATKVQVFSKTAGAWQTPINMPAGATRLWGLSLSPDGSKLAVSDAGAAEIYVLNPDIPATISSFSALTPAEVSELGQPSGLAITDSGVVYFMDFFTSFTGPAGLHKLDTTTGTLEGFQFVSAVDLGDDAFTRVLLSDDNSRAYINIAGTLQEIDTATDSLIFNPGIVASDYELALSSNQTWMAATEWLMDTNLNPQSFVTLNDRQALTTLAVFGAKLSPDGALLFQPLVDAIDVFDGKLGTLRTRVALPIQLSANYDALVDDGKDNVLLGIAGGNGDGGVVIIDLSGLPLPPPLAFAATNKVLPRNGHASAQKPTSLQNATVTKSATAISPVQSQRPYKHVVNDVRHGGGLRVLPDAK